MANPTTTRRSYNLDRIIITSGGDMPIHYHHPKKLSSSFSICGKKLVHLIPLIVLLCLFILWWFSYPVNLEMKDGKIVEVHRVLDIPYVRLTMLASSNSPHPSTSQPDQLIQKVPNNGDNDDTDGGSPTVPIKQPEDASLLD